MKNKETLEEAAERLYPTIMIMDYDTNEDIRMIWTDGAKLQAERIGLMEIELNHTKTLLASCEKALEDRDKKAERRYSEEEVIQILINYLHYLTTNDGRTSEEWFEQFKKK
jgi:hypothetical protein